MTAKEAQGAKALEWTTLSTRTILKHAIERLRVRIPTEITIKKDSLIGQIHQGVTKMITWQETLKVTIIQFMAFPNIQRIINRVIPTIR